MLAAASLRFTLCRGLARAHHSGALTCNHEAIPQHTLRYDRRRFCAQSGANIVVKADHAERARVPIHLLGSLVCFGGVSVSPAVMGFCAEEGVTITFLSQNGRFLARVEGPVAGNVLLRHDQHLRLDLPWPLSLLFVAL